MHSLLPTTAVVKIHFLLFHLHYKGQEKCAQNRPERIRVKGEAITSDEFVDILEAQKAAGAKERQKTKEREKEKEGKETIQQVRTKMVS